MFGRVRLLQWGTVLYAAASVPAALAGSATVLIVGVVALGIGAAVLTPASPIGGVFTQELCWRWILWFNVIVGVLILIGGFLLLGGFGLVERRVKSSATTR